MDSGAVTSACETDPPSTCSLWADVSYTDCLSCYPPYALITIGQENGETFCQ